MMQTNTWILCNAKVRTTKHDTSTRTYKGYKEGVEFWFCLEDIKYCLSGSKKKYVLDWPIIPNMWPMKTNLSKEEVLALEDVDF